MKKYLKLGEKKAQAGMEEKKQVIAEIKKKIGEAEIEEAIQRLLAFLEKHASYRHLRSNALQALSRYRKTKGEAAQGIISYEQAKLNYNQVTKQVLHLLETLEQEEQPGLRARRRWPIIVGLALLILALGGGAFWFFSRDAGCPPFDPASQEFGILLFPFYVEGDEHFDHNTPNLMRTRFEEFGALNELPLVPCTPEVPPELKEPPARIFFSTLQAEELGNTYRARLVIWGAKEKTSSDTLQITTRYKFIFPDQEDGFRMSQLALEENTEVQQVTSPIKIATDGELTGAIEASIIRWFSGIIAHETGHYEMAVESLKGLDVPTDSAGLVRDMMLSDSYLRLNDLDNAQATYDRVLEQHPNYWLGLHNRGVLYLKKGDYRKAIKDLNQRIAKNPNDAKSWFARGEAYLKLEQSQKARIDFEAARRLLAEDSLQHQPLRPLIERRLQSIEPTRVPQERSQ